MQDMKERRQAPAAAVFEEARVESFGDGILELAFPKDLAIYAKLASDDRHTEALQDAMERNLGVKPRLECRVGDSEPGAGNIPSPPGDEAPADGPEQSMPGREAVEDEDAPSPEPEIEKIEKAEPVGEPSPEVDEVYEGFGRG